MIAVWTMLIYGVPEFATTLARLADCIAGDILLGALVDAAQPMADRMSDHAPRGPVAPHLADSITVAPVRSDAVSAEVVIGPTKEFFYGMFWEFGWKYHAAHPFVRPGYDETTNVVLALFARHVWERIAAEGARGVSGP